MISVESGELEDFHLRFDSLTKPFATTFFKLLQHMLKNMRLAYVGDINGHGESVATTGTPLILILESIKEVMAIDIFCPKQVFAHDNISYSKKVHIIEIYDKNKPLSTLNLYSLDWGTYDLVIFNMLPTSFGNSSIINLLGILTPLFVKKKNVSTKVIYHNSTYTNNVKELGYNGIFDVIRKIVLSRIEKFLFLNIQVYLPLDIYVKKIKKTLPDAQVKYINMRYFEGLTTIFLNKEEVDNERFKFNSERKIPYLLLHGNWGPQKNIELALKILKKLKNEGYTFNLIVSGGINSHFPKYSRYFDDIIRRYSDIISIKYDKIIEKDIYKLFINTDLILIPYQSPGGHSGVLETALTFDLDIICISHPEFTEQVSGLNHVIFCDPERFEYEIATFLDRYSQRPKEVNIEEIQYEILNSIKTFLYD